MILWPGAVCLPAPAMPQKESTPFFPAAAFHVRQNRANRAVENKAAHPSQATRRRKRQTNCVLMRRSSPILEGTSLPSCAGAAMPRAVLLTSQPSASHARQFCVSACGECLSQVPLGFLPHAQSAAYRRYVLACMLAGVVHPSPATQS